MTGNPNQHTPAGELPPGLSPGGAAAFDKSGLLREYVGRYRCPTLIETGLYNGAGSGMPIKAAGVVSRYIAIDWQRENVEHARGLGFEAYCGDSAEVLASLLTEHLDIESPALFWLDAHALDEGEGSPQVCPLLGELDAIIASRYARSSVVLIDDLWGMGSLHGWPTMDELRERVDAAGCWDRDEAGGVMRLTPNLP